MAAPIQDIMERRLMGNLGVGIDQAVPADMADGDSSEDFGYKRIFVPLASDKNETTMIDFVKQQTDGEELSDEEADDMEVDEMLSAPRGADIVSTIIAKYVQPGKTARNLGYEEDPDLFDDLDVEERHREGDVDTVHAGFFVNAGNIDTKKRKREEPLEESPAKRRRGAEVDPPSKAIPAAVEAAIQELRQAAIQGGYQDVKRFPKELDPLLAKVATIAMAHHSNGWITLDVCNRVAQYLPFQPASLRARMKTLVGVGGDVKPEEQEDGGGGGSGMVEPSSRLYPGSEAANAAAQTAEDFAGGEEARIAKLLQLKKLRDELLLQFKDSIARKIQSLVQSGECAPLSGSDSPSRPTAWRWAPEQKQIILQTYELTGRIVKLHNKVHMDHRVSGRSSKEFGGELSERTEVSTLYKFLVNCFPTGWFANQNFAQMVTQEKKKYENKGVDGSAVGTDESSQFQPPPPLSATFASPSPQAPSLSSSSSLRASPFGSAPLTMAPNTQLQFGTLAPSLVQQSPVPEPPVEPQAVRTSPRSPSKNNKKGSKKDDAAKEVAGTSTAVHSEASMTSDATSDGTRSGRRRRVTPVVVEQSDTPQSITPVSVTPLEESQASNSMPSKPRVKQTSSASKVARANSPAQSDDLQQS